MTYCSFPGNATITQRTHYLSGSSFVVDAFRSCFLTRYTCQASSQTFAPLVSSITRCSSSRWEHSFFSITRRSAVIQVIRRLKSIRIGNAIRGVHLITFEPTFGSVTGLFDTVINIMNLPNHRYEESSDPKVLVISDTMKALSFLYEIRNICSC